MGNLFKLMISAQNFARLRKCIQGAKIWADNVFAVKEYTILEKERILWDKAYRLFMDSTFYPELDFRVEPPKITCSKEEYICQVTAELVAKGYTPKAIERIDIDFHMKGDITPEDVVKMLLEQDCRAGN
jgi:hypothetical protein